MPTDQPTRALIVADGDVAPAEDIAAFLPAATDSATLVVAADGGLRRADLLGLKPHLVVGDGDSLAPAVIDGLADRGIEVQLHPSAKDASDTELAVREAVRRGASEIVILGALGGLRFEHSLANVLLLAMPELDGCDVRLVDGRTTVRLVADGRSVELSADDGRLVSLLPLSERVDDVRTAGLRYALRGEPLVQGPTRGLSNEITEQRASVAVGHGRLAVVQTRAGEMP